MVELLSGQPMARRVCPMCSFEEPFDDTSRAWPLDWRCSECGHRAPVDAGIVLTAPELADTKSGIDPSNFQYLSEVEKSHFWFVARRKLILALGAKYAPTAKRYLEIGCGSGNVLKAFDESRSWARIIGTELHPKGLVLAWERIRDHVELLQADARHLPFRNAFDLVGAFDVLEHIVSDESVLLEIHKSLQDGGILIVTVPQHPSLWSVVDEVAYHVRRYRRGEVEKKLRSAGFDVVFSTSFVSILLPVIWLSRVLSGRPRGDASLIMREREFEVSSIVNRMMMNVLNGEIALTKRGVRWPVGGSRVVVARKRSAR